MSIKPISFGKIIQVNSPVITAEKIAKMANSSLETELAKQIKTIIDDTQLGNAEEVPCYGCKDKSYIFSGEEGKKFMKSFDRAYDEMGSAYNNNKSDADFITDMVWKRHIDFVNNMINSAKEIPVMDIKYDEYGKIQSINLLA